jgi:hypothetical protein
VKSSTKYQKKKSRERTPCLAATSVRSRLIYLSIKPPQRRANYFAGGVSAGFSAGGAGLAGGVAAGFFFSAQPVRAIAPTNSINAITFFMPWSPETIGQTHHPRLGWSIKYHVTIAQRLVASAWTGVAAPLFFIRGAASDIGRPGQSALKLCQTSTKYAF